MSLVTFVNKNDVGYLAFGGPFDGLCHGFSLRTGGVSRSPYDTLNTAYHVGDDEEAVHENRRRLAEAVGYPAEAVVAGNQVHKTKIVTVSRSDRGRGAWSAQTALPATDGLVCREPGVVLMAHAADCTLLYFYDPRAAVIGLAHAGWRGAVGGIGVKMVDEICRLGGDAGRLWVALSPTIRSCCYEVKDDFIANLRPGWREQVLETRGGRIYFDLPKLQRLLLQEAGVPAGQVIDSGICTCCRTDLFFSYRAGGVTGRMAGVLAL